MKIKIFILEFKSYYSVTNYVRNKHCEYGVHVTNSYIHAKFERVLLDVYRDIHHFINAIYYSRVDDVRRYLICMFLKNPNISETKQDIEKLNTPLSLICKCCSSTIKIGLTIFSLWPK